MPIHVMPINDAFVLATRGGTFLDQLRTSQREQKNRTYKS
jgi:hypothetical protein